MTEEQYREKFAEEFNGLMRLEGIWTNDMYSFMKRFFRLRDLQINEKNWTCEKKNQLKPL